MVNVIRRTRPTGIDLNRWFSGRHECCSAPVLLQQLVELRRIVARTRSSFVANPPIVVGGLTNQIDNVWN